MHRHLALAWIEVTNGMAKGSVEVEVKRRLGSDRIVTNANDSHVSQVILFTWISLASNCEGL